MLPKFSYAILLAVISYVRALEVCCPTIGCFNDNPPYNGQPLPDCLERIQPRYVMYDRSNRVNGQGFDHLYTPAVFSREKRTVFIAHGWQSSASDPWVVSMKNAFLDREDMNVVIVGWDFGAGTLYYPQAAANTRSTGAYTAMVYNRLVSNGGSNTRMWCVGHSLGAHMCGFAGMKTTLQRVTGLDPAGPWFQDSFDKTVGLNPLSARFVDVIHTDTTYGTLRDFGHIDFYPNGGQNQPGCADRKTDLAPAEWEARVDLGCSHSRATVYMEQSVRSDCFYTSTKCTNNNNLPGSCSPCSCGGGVCAVMGFGAEYGCQRAGFFWVDVVATAPYCTN